MNVMRLLGNEAERVKAREEELLDLHARAVMAGNWDEARRLREEQPADLANLMQLAEQLAIAVRPIAVRVRARQRMRESILERVMPGRSERLMALMRAHSKEAVVGAALIGTAVSLGKVALHFRRKKQNTVLPANVGMSWPASS